MASTQMQGTGALPPIGHPSGGIVPKKPTTIENRLTRIMDFSSALCAGCRDSRPRLAEAHLAIVNFVHDLSTGYDDPEMLLFDFLREQHDDPDLADACNAVLKHVDAAPGRR